MEAAYTRLPQAAQSNKLIAVITQEKARDSAQKGASSSGERFLCGCVKFSVQKMGCATHASASFRG